VVNGTLSGLAGGVAYAVTTGGKVDYESIAADAFGNALGNSIVDRMAPQSMRAPGAPRSSLDLDADIEAGIADTRARNEADLQAMAASMLDNNPRLMDPSRILSPDQQMAQAASAQWAAEAVQRIPDPPADLRTLEEVVVTAPRELNPYAQNFLQTRGDYYRSLMLSNWSAQQRTSQSSTSQPEIDRSLYVAPGFFKSAYDIAAAGFDDPNSSFWEKTGYFAGAGATAIPTFIEEAGRFIANVPDSASVGGQLLARGNLATDTDTKVESYLGALTSFANAFNGLAALTPPSLMLPNMSGVPAVTMSAEELAAVRQTYAQDGVVASEGRITGQQWNEYFVEKYGAENVKWAWPANQGFVYGADSMEVLQTGRLFGRIGSESGTFAAPLGTAPETLSLRPGTDLSNYNVYRVIKPFEVRSGPAAPAFDMPGYGTQYQLPKSVSDLIKEKFLEPVINR